MAGDPRVTWEGCSVLLDINDGDRLVFARLSPNATVKIGAKKCLLSPLIGCPFGSLFRIDTGPGGRPILARCAADADAIQERDNLQVKDDHRDNRALVDNNKAQNLSSEDIDAMRREGATGDEIVEALIANSSTFDQKTMFSQEKYKLKKQKKYAPKVLLRRPFCRSICEAYFKKHPARIGFLRMDTLSLLLSMANVSAYSDVLLVDMVGGMLTGAVAERLGGTGYVCSTYFGAKLHPLDIVRMFNFNSEVCRRIVQASFADLCTAQTNKNGYSPLHPSSHSSDIEPTTSIVSPSTESILPVASILNLAGQESVQEENAIADDIHESNVPAVHKSVNPGKQASPESISLWKGRGFTSLIIAAPELEVGSMVQELLPLLSYSAPFAIYQQYLQPLATCMHRLQSSKMAINLQISEPWLREYQVLPSRTHPHMQMSAFGGYILSGIRICDNEVCNGNKQS